MALLDFLKFKDKKEKKPEVVYNLLVVDDDEELTSSLALLKYPEDTKVIFVTSALDAIKLIKEKKVDAVMADINMPHMDLLNKVLEREASELPIFRMSGAVDKFLNLMLNKPFSKEEFLDAIKQLKGMSRIIKRAS